MAKKESQLDNIINSVISSINCFLVSTLVQLAENLGTTMIFELANSGKP